MINYDDPRIKKIMTKEFMKIELVKNLHVFGTNDPDEIAFIKRSKRLLKTLKKELKVNQVMPKAKLKI